MKRQGIRWLGYSIALLCLAITPTTSTADILSPTVDGSIRDGVGAPKDGQPDFVLENGVVQALDVPGQAERGIIEFSLSGLSQPITNAQLVLSVFASTGPFPFTIDVFTYAGDGALTLSDWMEGAFFTSFSYAGEQTITLDVTSFIDSAVAAGYTFAGFNFRFAGPSPIPPNGPFVAFNSLEVPPAASLRINEREVLNTELSGEVKAGTTVFDPTPVPEGPAGTFAFTAEFCNTGSRQLTALASETSVLTTGNVLHNRDSGTPPAVGSLLTFSANGGYTDMQLDPGECVEVLYQIGLAKREPFQFFVDVVEVP